ncbi:Dol-P-Glc:Glc(2)Man(9)GlcNAc(2)-PP-Dol alpha-1 2-glucosyltransferase [Euphorbia peplus]|nr:Dol-P-Glc:Glc(2)Man(9)GlcNAc(2)-PP-Dol alpha-1 2-glucosyltransferase [Euphorbia peplus]
MRRLAVAVIVSLFAIPTSFLVNRIVPEPYMDEIFHIPQAQQYCKGNFWSWDPMITTPPGLYYLSLAHVACLFPGMLLVQVVSSFSELCSTGILRSVNGFLAVLCSILLYEIITHLRPTLSERKAAFISVILALYPLHWFFTFLYYTDIASLASVLAMYLACLKKKYHLSALIGVIAVLIRQTNIIWMLFVACIGIIDITLAHENKNAKADELKQLSNETGQLISRKSVTSGSNVRKRNTNNTVKTSTHMKVTENDSSKIHSSGFLEEVQEICITSWRMKSKLIVYFSPFVLVLVGFAVFVRWNGSVVLGAKEAHVVSPHFAQIMYFGVVSALATAPLHFSLGQGAYLSRSFWKNKPLSFCLVLAALTVGFLSVHFFSIAHPYLVADNRHYPFYLWRKIVKAHWLMKYILVPLYVYSWFSIFSVLGKVRPKIWILAYFLATSAVLVPAPLIEFRYYTIPFYFLVLNSRVSDNQSWIMMGMIYMVINVFTMGMFLFRPFYWNHEPGIQRFIW